MSMFKKLLVLCMMGLGVSALANNELEMTCFVDAIGDLEDCYSDEFARLQQEYRDYDGPYGYTCPPNPSPPFARCYDDECWDDWAREKEDIINDMLQAGNQCIIAAAQANDCDAAAACVAYTCDLMTYVTMPDPVECCYTCPITAKETKPINTPAAVQLALKGANVPPLLLVEAQLSMMADWRSR